MNNPFVRKHSSNKTLKLVVHRLRNRREGIQSFLTYGIVTEGQTQARNAYTIRVRYSVLEKAYVLTVTVDRAYSRVTDEKIERSLWPTIRALDTYLFREYNKVFAERDWRSPYSWHICD